LANQSVDTFYRIAIILSFYSKKTSTSKVGDELRLLPT